jgi:hypothetical protein
MTFAKVRASLSQRDIEGVGQVSSNDQSQECFVELDIFQNTVIDIEGRLIYSQEFAQVYSEIVYESIRSYLSSKLSEKGVSILWSNLNGITNVKGIPAKLLRPGSPWIAGRVRMRLVVEFEPEETGSGSSRSPLDDIRGDVSQ